MQVFHRIATIPKESRQKSCLPSLSDSMYFVRDTAAIDISNKYVFPYTISHTRHKSEPFS